MSTLPMYLLYLYFKYFHVSPVCQFSNKTLFLEDKKQYQSQYWTNCYLIILVKK